ncbi:MAG TPA: ribose 5-phosphate isomerase B [Planctomycetaceae bacterium]|nr:ribose 5-phosphate isomerase B [Planctomycetaceae bacterium]
MRLALGSDFVGYALKEGLKSFLAQRGIEVVDYGTDSEEPCDYPIFARRVAEAVARGECDQGVLVCGTGIGMSIAANKVRGVRCALCHDIFTARLARQHNDANILALGARVVSLPHAEQIVAAWLDEEYEGGRHDPRLRMIAEMQE